MKSDWRGPPVAPMWCLSWQSGKQFSSVPDLNLNDFHGLADQILENILDKLIVVEESMDDVDISYAVWLSLHSLSSSFSDVMFAARSLDC